MRVLVTNDDGITSEGLHVLANSIAETGHHPVVAAPSSDWSGSSACLGPIDDPKRVPVEQVDIPTSAGSSIAAYSVGGPPALITMLASLGGFGDPPEAVVAGINRGPNTGRSTLFSGTIGAVLAGERFGWSGLAVSLDALPLARPGGSVEGPYWRTTDGLVRLIFPWVISAPARTILNLNVPNRPEGEVKGLRGASLAPVGGVRTVITGRDEEGLDIDVVTSELPVPEGSDSSLLREGWATVTSLVPTHAAEIDLPLEVWETGWLGQLGASETSTDRD